MLNSVNNINWNNLVYYITRIVVNYGSFTFIIVPGHSPAFGKTFSSHVFLERVGMFIQFWWGLTGFILSFL